MNCMSSQQLISRLRDGELPSGESAGVFEHLSVCENCRDFYYALQALEGALGRIADHVPHRSGVRPLPLPGAVKEGMWWNHQVSLRLPVLALLLCAFLVSLIVLLPGSSLFREPQAIYVTKLPTVVVDATTAPPEPMQ